MTGIVEGSRGKGRPRMKLIDELMKLLRGRYDAWALRRSYEKQRYMEVYSCKHSGGYGSVRRQVIIISFHIHINLITITHMTTQFLNYKSRVTLIALQFNHTTLCMSANCCNWLIIFLKIYKLT